MSTIRFNNFTASSRKADMKPFGLMPASTDLSWVGSSSDAVPYDLSAQVDGTSAVFTIPVRASFVILVWNNDAVYQSSTVPGFTLAGTSVSTNFTPQVGDSLIARVWPQ